MAWVISSWMAKISVKSRSKRSAQTWPPSLPLISCAGDAHAATQPFARFLPGHVAHAKLLADLLHLYRLALVGKRRVRAITKSPETFDRSVMMSSVMPSLKYSCSGSPLMLVKGSTAMDGRSTVCRDYGGTHDSLVQTRHV